jgi:hypothetical protein
LPLFIADISLKMTAREYWTACQRAIATRLLREAQCQFARHGQYCTRRFVARDDDRACYHGVWRQRLGPGQGQLRLTFSTVAPIINERPILYSFFNIIDVVNRFVKQPSTHQHDSSARRSRDCVLLRQWLIARQVKRIEDDKHAHATIVTISDSSHLTQRASVLEKNGSRISRGRTQFH